MEQEIPLYKVVLWSMPFIVLLLGLNGLNLKRKYRGRQVIAPIIAVLFCFLVMAMLTEIEHTLSEKIIGLGWLVSFFDDLPSNASMIYILNFTIVLIYVVVKVVVMLGAYWFWKSDEWMQKTSLCYEPVQAVVVPHESDENGKTTDTGEGAKFGMKPIWCLKERCKLYQRYMNGAYIACSILSIFVFILSQWKTSWEAFQAPFYPVFAIIMLGEIRAYLNGPDHSEKRDCVETQENQSNKIADFDFLRQELRTLFGDRCLYDYYVPCALSHFEEQTQAGESKTACEAIAEAYFSHISSALNQNYVNSAVKLISGHSVLISNPFYRDLTPYLMLPILRTVLNFRRCLVIVSRDSSTKDVKTWLNSGIKAQCGTTKLWRAEVLTTSNMDVEIGILRGHDLYNDALLDAHDTFLQEVGFIILLEPSHILATGQLGLSLLVSRCEASGKRIVYCAIDRNCDGLVDALSHAFKTNITEVTATITSDCCCSGMYWEADGTYLHHRLPDLRDIAHYLGMGIELNLVAMKHKSEHHLDTARWISSEKFPVVDMKWIAGQYYKKLCRYIGLPESQAAFEASFSFESNLWSDLKKDGAWLTIEDEFYNLFEMTRVFSSRAFQRIFINIISEQYFLRDYMVDNFALFSTDSKAIPTIVPEYARTARNTILKLLFLMSNKALGEKFICQEFEFCNVYFEQRQDNDGVIKKLQDLIQFHCGLNVELEKGYLKDQSVLSENESECYYRYTKTPEIQAYFSQLKTAYFCTEDERGENHYIAARLYGHVYQSYLPGQFVTFEGKYYQVQRITQSHGVILRRAADHIHHRIYYRQMRHVHFEGMCDENIISVAGLEHSFGLAKFEIRTNGYLEMAAYHDMRTAKEVIISDIPNRRYMHKMTLRIKLPRASEKVRYTICLLLNEIFRTTYPDAKQYIFATLPLKELHPKQTRHVIYDMDGVEDEACIYIFEDSEIDLGLVLSIERHLKRYFEIICDVLLWHKEKMIEMPSLIQMRSAMQSGDDDDVEWQTKVSKMENKLQPKGHHLNLWMRFMAWLKCSLKMPKIVANPLDNVVVAENCISESDDEVVGRMDVLVEKTRYQKHCFLLFGFDQLDDAIDIDETITYLSRYGFQHNPLQQVRRNLDLIKLYGKNYDVRKPNTTYCAFCGNILEDEELLLFSNQRVICHACAHSLVDVDKTMTVLLETRHALEQSFGIKIGMSICLRYASLSDIRSYWCACEGDGAPFDKDAVRFGFVIRYAGYGCIETVAENEVYRIYVEPEMPILCLVLTFVHVLVDAWAHSQANVRDHLVSNKQFMNGLKRWTEIQTMIQMGEVKYARRLEIATRSSDDVISRDAVTFFKRYPLDYLGLWRVSPFAAFEASG